MMREKAVFHAAIILDGRMRMLGLWPADISDDIAGTPMPCRRVRHAPHL